MNGQTATQQPDVSTDLRYANLAAALENYIADIYQNRGVVPKRTRIGTGVGFLDDLNGVIDIKVNATSAAEGDVPELSIEAKLGYDGVGQKREHRFVRDARRVLGYCVDLYNKNAFFEQGAHPYGHRPQITVTTV